MAQNGNGNTTLIYTIIAATCGVVGIAFGLYEVVNFRFETERLLYDTQIQAAEKYERLVKEGHDKEIEELKKEINKLAETKKQ